MAKKSGNRTPMSSARGPAKNKPSARSHSKQQDGGAAAPLRALAAAGHPGSISGEAMVDAIINGTRASDRRRIGLSLTPEGDKVLKSVRKKRTAWLVERLERLEPGERESIEGSIDALEKLLGDE